MNADTGATPAVRFILASNSPRRRELLARHGFAPEIVPSNVPEFEDADADPREMVLRNAAAKARHVADANPDALVLGADTVVAIGDRVLNKPADLAEARAMLHLLAGREHTVFTGTALVRRAAGVDELDCVSCRVRFRPLDDAAITRYFALVNPLDKAGAYGIQEGREIIIASYDEPLSCIMGLPVEHLAPRLRALLAHHR
ncbi:MAG: Maf family protein [Puniceicoccales bacterium]|jgi:septum formation protein|nr:Maf family protein [Puniceicoccales bacterium]